MMDNGSYQTLKEIAGAIFFALLSLYDEQAEREAIAHLRSCISSGAITDPDALSILDAIIGSSESNDLSSVPSTVLQNILALRPHNESDGPSDGVDAALSELMRRESRGSA